jgi:predicted permease
LWRPFELVVDDLRGMGGMLNVVGRLSSGVAADAAQAELTVIARRLEIEHQSYSSDWRITVVPLLDATVRDVKPMLLVLFGAVTMVLLGACVNVANLLLSRSAARQREFAVRRAMGATTARIVRQLLTEALVLSACGGALAVVLAVWGTDVLVSLVPAGLDLPRTREIGASARMFSFALVMTTITAVLLGLVPSLTSARSDAVALREAARGASMSRRRHFAGSALIVSEMALALVLVAGAGLLIRSFRELALVEPGFQSDRVMTLRVALPSSKYDTDERIRAFGNELLERIERVRGMRAVGSVGYLPMSNIGTAEFFEIEGRALPDPRDRASSWISIAGGRYFEAMRIPLIRGRLPGPTDTERTQPVFVIDEQLARKYWPNGDAIGARLIWRRDGKVRLAGEVIGIVGGVRWAGRAASAQPTTYFWFPQRPEREINIAARTDADPEQIAAAIAAEVRAMDPNQPVGRVRAMDDLVSADLARPRFTMLVLGVFAVAALVLAALGLYGVIAFWVTQRTREIGVRVALGAQYDDVLRLVLLHGLSLSAAGIAIGVTITLGLGRMVSGLLYGIQPADPATLATSAIMLAGIAMAATFIPARRAARVDPIVALRADS